MHKTDLKIGQKIITFKGDSTQRVERTIENISSDYTHIKYVGEDDKWHDLDMNRIFKI